MATRITMEIVMDVDGAELSKPQLEQIAYKALEDAANDVPKDELEKYIIYVSANVDHPTVVEP